MKIFSGFDDVDVDEKRKTKDERRKTSIEKEQKKVKKTFSNKCVSSQKHCMRKEEGATVAASHLPSLSWLVRQAGRAASPRKPYFTGKLHKIP